MKNLMHFLLILFLLGLGCASALTADIAVVRREHPHFLKTMERHLHSHELTNLLERWTQDESAMLQSALKTARSTAERHGAIITKDNYRKFVGANLFGMFGELYLGLYMRQKFHAAPSMIVMNAWRVDEVAKDTREKGSLPDGLVYKTIGRNLVIYHVLESKMGDQRFGVKQARNYFSEWKRRGITVVDKKGDNLHFGPKQITFVGGQSINKMSFTSFLDFTVTAGSQFRVRDHGDYIGLPFDSDTAWLAAEDLGMEVLDLSFDKNVRTRDLHSNPSRTSRRKIPLQKMASLRRSLSTWFWSQESNHEVIWPKKGLFFGGVDGRKLRRKIQEAGGSSEVFIHYTDDRLKKMLFRRNSLPIIRLLEAKLLAAKKGSEELKGAFEIYFKAVERGTPSSQLGVVKARYKKIYKDDYDRVTPKNYNEFRTLEDCFDAYDFDHYKNIMSY